MDYQRTLGGEYSARSARIGVIPLQWTHGGRSGGPAGLLASVFCRSRYQSICAQLRARPAVAMALWPDNDQVRHVRDTISLVVKDEFMWPNELFIPSDPCAILFWEHSARCSYFQAVVDILTELDLRASDVGDCVLVPPEGMRYGEFVASVAQSLRSHGRS